MGITSGAFLAVFRPDHDSTEWTTLPRAKEAAGGVHQEF